ncbi:MAG: GMP synthase (glutamine-hydrolyzing), partial [Bacteroidales bacterium]|nr:GMP synthase (glutamine-hydrolyzing) [Bacteroidales bacterium]
MQEKIVVLDFGSQTTQLIARRIRELSTFCEIYPYNKFPDNTEGIKGVILSGSPFSVYDKKAFDFDLNLLRKKIPLLGICYGAQLIVHKAGGKVEASGSREYGRAFFESVNTNDPL